MKNMLSEALCMIRGLLNQLLTNLEGENGEEWLKEFKKFLRKESCWVKSSNNLLSMWQTIYHNNFGIECDFSEVVIPEKPSDGDWRLLVIADINLEQIYARCKELFQCWRWTDDDFDKIVTWNERDAKNGAYAIWVRDEVEADENLKNHSVNDIKEKNIATETLTERLIHELIFFDETGKHLDNSSVTLCGDSRVSDGGVLSVRFIPDTGGVYVSRYDPDGASDVLRFRQVVS